MHRDGKVMGNYFSWKMVVSITYQEQRKPQDPHSHEGSVEERVGARKAYPSPIIFLTHLSVKKTNASKILCGQ